jgi:plasmid stabilization system protein ParE
LASAELGEVVDYYLANAGAPVSRSFATAVSTAVRLMLEHPQIGVRTGVKARRLAVHGFPYDLVYRVAGETLVILAVSSHSRRPRYWAGRR